MSGLDNEKSFSWRDAVIGSAVFDWISGGIVFLHLAVIVCVLSFALPAIQIKGIPARMEFGLAILHLVAAMSAGVGTVVACLG